MLYPRGSRTGTGRRSTALAALGCCLLLSVWGGGSRAGEKAVDYTEYSLEDLMEMNVVYGASKHLQRADEAPSSITIVTADQIKTYGYRTLAEVLASLRGFHITYDRNYHYIGVRGLGEPGDLSSRILVLVDGIRVNEGSIGGVLLGHGFPVDIDLIERIEVIRGPASSLYGTNAMLGIINVVTREGYQLDGFELQGGAESFGGRSARVTMGHETLGGVDMIFSGRWGEVTGQDHYIEEFDVPDYSDGWFRDGDRELWRSFFGKVLYGGLTLEALHSWRSKRNPMAPGWTIMNCNQAQTVDEQTAVSARFRTRLWGHTDMSAHVYYQYFASDGQWPYDFDYEGYPVDWVDLYLDTFRGKRLTAALDFSRRFGEHVVAVGGEYQNNFQMDMRAVDDNPFYEWFDYRQTPKNWGAYALAELRLLRNLLLNLGVRHDEYTTFGSSNNPRLAIVAEPVAGTVLKALYGKAFRAPNGYEISAAEAADTRANISLIPEEITTWEVILEQDLGRGFFGTAAAFDYDYRAQRSGEDEIDPDLPYNEWVNDDVRSKGVEVEVERRDREGFEGRLSWSYVDARDRYYNPRWADPKGPRHMLKLNLQCPLQPAGNRLGVEVQYTSPRESIMREWAHEYTLCNLSLTNTSLIDGFVIQGGIYNLFDKHYAQPGTWGEYQEFIWQDGRSFRLYITDRH